MQLGVALGILEVGARSAVLVPMLTLLACGIIFTALRRGATGVSLVSNILFAHVFVGLWMLYLLVSHRWPELLAAHPPLAAPDRLWNYTTGVELGIGTTLSWWPYIGAMIRMAPDGRTIVLPVLLGMAAPVPLLSLIGLAGALVLKSSDPAEWLRTVGGPTYAIVSLGFVTAANFGTTTAGIYASAIGLRNFSALQRRSWTTLLLITITPVALVGIFIPELFFAKFGNFLALIGVAFAPLCGIQMIDYFVLRRRRIDIRAIYADEPGGAYYFWRGINPAALLALAAGCCTYVLLAQSVELSLERLVRLFDRLAAGGGGRGAGVFAGQSIRHPRGPRRLPIMSDKILPGQARVVIIGGGVIGCSIAYHLTKLGCRDVMLLERAQLTAGTTWHAAGLLTSLRDTETQTRLAKYSQDLYRKLESETGQATGLIGCGSIQLAMTADKTEEMRRGLHMAACFGVEAYEITPAEVKRMWPLAAVGDLKAAFYFPNDGRVNPTDVTQALAKGARLGGAQIFENTKVTGILTEQGRVAGVRTAAGERQGGSRRQLCRDVGAVGRPHGGGECAAAGGRTLLSDLRTRARGASAAADLARSGQFGLYPRGGRQDHGRPVRIGGETLGHAGNSGGFSLRRHTARLGSDVSVHREGDAPCPVPARDGHQTAVLRTRIIHARPQLLDG